MFKIKIVIYIKIMQKFAMLRQFISAKQAKSLPLKWNSLKNKINRDKKKNKNENTKYI